MGILNELDSFAITVILFMYFHPLVTFWYIEHVWDKQWKQAQKWSKMNFNNRQF